MDSFTETSSEGWWSRIIGSVKSVVVGLVLFLLSFPLLWCNEGRAVQTAKSLDEGAAAVTSVQADKVDGAHEGALVHLTGMARTDDSLKDGDFGVSLPAIKLVRSVEMYQWVERKTEKKKKKVGGSEKTTINYRYVKEWSAKAHDSDDFRKSKGHHNPSLRYESKTRLAQQVTVGAFNIPEDQVASIDGESLLPVDSAALAKLTPTLQGKTVVLDGSFIVRPEASSADFDAREPEVGDHRVRFSAVRAQDVSLVARQVGSSFTPFETKAGDKLFLLRTGRHSADAMFQQAQEANSSMTWILRAVGFLMMAFGIGLMFRPLTVMADVIPFVGDLLGIGLTFLALAIATPLSCLTIALAWVAARPLVGGAMLVLFAAMVVGVVMVAVKRRQARATA